VPEFSNRDPVFNDIAAPGAGIFSTFPLALTSVRPMCPDQGYSDCGLDEYRNPEGTSFAAPQVSAAAAVLFAVNPALTNAQVTTLLEHSADDANAANGCAQCALLRDRLSGWGRLDVAKAVESLAGPLPSPDRYETNDDAGTHAHTLWGKQTKLTATLDFYDDQIDVYRVSLGRGERLRARLTGGWSGANVNLVLWKPGTKDVDDLASQNRRAAASIAPGAAQRLAFTAPERGWYYVEAKVVSPGSGPYTLTLAKSTTQPKA
jgi:subtilase family protein